MIAEQNVIGALLLTSGTAWPEVADVLKPEDFNDSTCRAVWSAVAALAGHGKPADIVTVADELERTKSGVGLADVGELAHNTASAANVRAYADIVRLASSRRQAADVAQAMLEAIDRDGMAAVDAAVRDLTTLTLGGTGGAVSLADTLAGVLKDIDRAQSSGGMVGLTTGLADLDFALGGLPPGDLVIVGARPSMGKTALMLCLADAADQAGTPVGIVSSEQSQAQVAMRLLALRGPLSVHRMRTGRMDDADWPRLTHAASLLNDSKIEIMDRSQPTIAEIERQARAWRHRAGIGALYVDYIQRLRGSGRERRHEDVGDVVRGLKGIARDLEIPVVALAQVNRSVEARGDKRPLPGDLKDSGEIEQEADEILMLYRDEVYRPDSHEAGTAEINITKNRHGPTGRLHTAWLADSMRFANLAPRAAA